MSDIKNLVAIASDASSGEVAVRAALSLARRFDCHLDVLHVRSDPTAALPLVGEAMSGAAGAEMMELAEKQTDRRGQDARAMFDRLSAEAGLSDDAGNPLEGKLGISWIEETGVEEQIVASRACRADMIVIARPTADNETSALMTLNAALMQSGRPVWAAPPGAKAANMDAENFKRIAVFWNGSVEATRAVAAAQPFFAAAEEVVILRVEEEEWFAPTEDLEAYLTRHNTKAVVCKVLPREGRTGRALLAATSEINADLMVMGAYTRSKLRQLILGSVTGYVMHEATLPVLMSH